MVRLSVLPITCHENPDGVYSGLAMPFHDLSTSMGMGGQHHAPAALPPDKDPVPIVQEAR